MPAKSKILSSLNIPAIYFQDFLRGCIDGDGTIHVFKHPESQFKQLSLKLISASRSFLEWVYQNIKNHFHIEGGWIEERNRAFTLNYGKSDSIKLFRFMYYNKVNSYLNRKYLIAKSFID